MTYPFIIFDKIASILKNFLVSVTYVLTTKKLHLILVTKYSNLSTEKYDIILFRVCAPIAQLDRAADFGSASCGFDSY